MKRNFLPFALPQIEDEEINEVAETLRSGWVTTGPKVKIFEDQFSRFIGSGVESIAVNSATAGLHLALESLAIGEGDEVIVPTYTFTATAEVVRYLGATPVFVDVLESTFNIDPEAIQRAITPRTKVIMPVHFAGLACDMSAIFKLAKQYNLKVVEDAAHALPSTYKGQLVGSLDSDITVFSFYANKTMTTGEGGMVVTKNPDLAKRFRIMRLHGISRDMFDRYTSTKPSWFYEVVAPGYKYNMTDIAAAIGIQQLKKLPEFQKIRERMARIYNSELKNIPLILPENAPSEEFHARHLYPILLEEDCSIGRDSFITKMVEKGIGCSVHFIPLHLHPYWSEKYKLSASMFPIAQKLFKREVSIPLFTSMTQDDQKYVVASIKSVLKNA